MIGKQRLSATVDAELLAAAEQAAAHQGSKNLSAWINEAIRTKLEHDRRLQALSKLIAEFEAEHGVITVEQIAATRREMAGRAIVVRGRRRTRQAPRKRARR